MNLTIEEQMLIEQRVTNASKSAGAAYLLWLLLFFVAGHRFYLGRPGTAILQILSFFVLIGVVWWLIDGFLIPGMIQRHNAVVRQRLTDAMIAQKQQAANSAAVPAP